MNSVNPRRWYDENIRKMEPGVTQAILKTLSAAVGELNAVSREQLVSQMRYLGFLREVKDITADRKCRHVIRELRQAGYLICASEKEGYFFPADWDEYDRFVIREIITREEDLRKTHKAMDAAAPALLGPRPSERGQLNLL